MSAFSGSRPSFAGTTSDHITGPPWHTRSAARASITTTGRSRNASSSDQTCSAGLAQWDGREHPDAVIRRADEALYAAKASGRDRTTVAA